MRPKTVPLPRSSRRAPTSRMAMHSPTVLLMPRRKASPTDSSSVASIRLMITGSTTIIGR